MSVKVENLTKVYGAQKAVDNLSFEINKGQILGFLGPNGAGKTTTMKILTCFIPQTSGEASVCGLNVSQNAMAVRQKIGYLPEHNPLYKDMYVKEYLKFIAGLHKLGKQTKGRIAEMIDVTGLEREQKKKIGQLSKGFRQRVGLAQAMIHNPEVLILDEPTTGLDPNQLAEIRLLIKQLGQEKTVILSTHIMQEVQAICDKVLIINKGRQVANDSKEALTQKLDSKSVVLVEFKQQLTEARLKAINGVTNIQRVDDKTWSLATNTNKDLREVVFEFAKEKHLTLLRLQQDEHSIEDVFKKVTK